MAFETYHLELKDELDTRIITDMVAVAVAEKGKPDNDATRIECGLVLAFARLKVKHKSGLKPDPVPEQDKLFDKYNVIPRRIAFWVTTMLRKTPEQARLLGDVQYVQERRFQLYRDTVLDS